MINKKKIPWNINENNNLFCHFFIGYGGYVGAMVTTYDISRHLVPRKLNLKDGSNTIEGNWFAINFLHT